MVSILIVEDDENIAKMIEATLSMVGYRCAVCADGAGAVEKILEGSFDLILLDVMLPGMDGFEILEKIKNKGTPVIFLTARNDVTDKVRGLRQGAEDYIVKPFETVELLARIEVVLRRTDAYRKTLRYCEIEVDLQRHAVFRSGERVTLTPKEFDVLVFFLEHIDIAITRERLLAAVWGYEFQGESRTVDIHVQQVRRKMGLKGRLCTIPKLGWCLESRP